MSKDLSGRYKKTEKIQKKSLVKDIKILLKKKKQKARIWP